MEVVRELGQAEVQQGVEGRGGGGWGVPRAAKHSCQLRTRHTPLTADTARFSPDQLFVVQGLGGLPSQDVDLTLEDVQLHFALDVLLGLDDAVSDEFKLWTVPETWGETGEGERSINATIHIIFTFGGWGGGALISNWT